MQKNKSKSKHKLILGVSLFIILNLLILGYMQVYTVSQNSVNKEQIVMSNVTFDESGNYNIQLMGKDILKISPNVSLSTQQNLISDTLLPSHIQIVTEILDFINK